MDKLRRLVRKQTDLLEYLATPNPNQSPPRKHKKPPIPGAVKDVTERAIENALHDIHRTKNTVLDNLRPAYEALNENFFQPIGAYTRELIHRYKLTETHQSLVTFRRRLQTRPPSGYQLRPVIFCLNLDNWGMEKAFRELYDEIFLAIMNLRHQPDGPKSNTPELHFISTADLVLLSQAQLKNAKVTVTESFAVFVAQSADSVILVAEDIWNLPEVVKEAFRGVYTKTDLKDLPLLCLLLNPIAERQDELWQRRMAAAEAVGLRDVLLEFGVINVPYKIRYVRSGGILGDTERALAWLWRHTGVREKQRAVPLSTSVTKKRWSSRRPSRPSIIDRRGSMLRRHSVLLAVGEAVRPTTGRRVRINPIPTNMEYTPIVACSLAELPLTSRRARSPTKADIRLSRSLSRTALNAAMENHPDLINDLLSLQPKKARRASLPARKMSTGVYDAAARAEAAAKAAAASMKLARSLVDEEAEKMVRERFIKDETKFAELKEYEKQLKVEQTDLQNKIQNLMEFLQTANSPVLEIIQPPPSWSEEFLQIN